MLMDMRVLVLFKVVPSCRSVKEEVRQGGLEGANG